MVDEHLRYLGCVSLLAEAYRHVPEDMQGQIESALADAAAAVPALRVCCMPGVSISIDIVPEEGG